MKEITIDGTEYYLVPKERSKTIEVATVQPKYFRENISTLHLGLKIPCFDILPEQRFNPGDIIRILNITKGDL